MLLLVLRFQGTVTPFSEDTFCRVLPSAHHIRFTRAFPFSPPSVRPPSPLQQANRLHGNGAFGEKNLCAVLKIELRKCAFILTCCLLLPPVCAPLVVFVSSTTKYVRARLTSHGPKCCNIRLQVSRLNLAGHKQTEKKKPHVFVWNAKH